MYPYIESCVRSELKRIKIDSTKATFTHKRAAARDGIINTRHSRITVAVYSRKFEIGLLSSTYNSADVYQCSVSVHINLSEMIPMYTGTVLIPDFTISEVMKAKRDYLLQRLRDVSDRSEAFYNSLPKSGVVDKVEMAAEIKNLMTKEALKESPDLKLALSERFGVKF